MTVKLLTEYHLEFLSLKGGCTGSYESTLVKMSHCLKPHVAAHIYLSPQWSRLPSVLMRSICCRLFIGDCCSHCVLCFFLVLKKTHLAEKERAGCSTSLYYCCSVPVSVLCLFFSMPWVGLWYVIEAFAGPEVIQLFPCST